MLDYAAAKKIANELFLFGFEEYDTAEIISLLEFADDLYHNDEEPVISDADYDSIRRYVQISDPGNPYILGVGSSVRGEKVPLPHQMGSLDQVHTGEISDWIRKWTIQKEQGVVSHKLDGYSALACYTADGDFNIGFSRGDGVEGADISRHLRLIPTVPQHTPFYNQSAFIRGEIIIPVANFPIIQKLVKTRNNKQYKNPRNCVSGLMNASSNIPELYQHIHFIAYEIVGSTLSKIDQLKLLKNLGFSVVKHSLHPFSILNDTSLEALLKDAKSNSIYELDGLVVEVNSAEKRALISPTKNTLNPAHTVKFKIADDTNVAIVPVVDVEINISKHGYLKPRVEIKPVDLVGVTVTWATGFNMKFIRDNRIGPGSKIKITRSGDVIPFITDVIEPLDAVEFHDWFQQKTTQFGAVDWTETGVDLVLQNAQNNDTVKYEQLVDFFNSIGVPHLGEGNLQKVFDRDFQTIEEIIELTQEDWVSMIGSNGKKIFLGMKEKLTDIPMYNLMGAYPGFGRGVGVRKMKKLYDAFNGDMTKCANVSAIVQVEGFEEKTAQKIQSGYPIFCEFLENISKYVTIKPYEAPKSGVLSGISVVFTGFRNSELEKQVENAGGKIGSSVSSKTGLVVTNDPSGTTGKLGKARELKINIIGIDELKAML